MSIALVAALTTAAVYYGGTIYERSQAHAKATTITTQGIQILSAAQMFYAATGRWPKDLDELVSLRYLQSIPQAPILTDASGTLVPQAYAATGTMAWSAVQLGAPYYWLHNSVGVELCKEVNRVTRGDNGIYNAARPTLQSQCFGKAAEYTVVIGFPPGDSRIPLGTVLPGADPALEVDETGKGWAVPPDGTAPQSPLSKALVNFGSVRIGQSAPDTVTLTNRSGKTVAVASITGLPAEVSRATSGPGVCGSANFTLAPNASCNINLTFTPTTLTPVTATLSINSNYGGHLVLNVLIEGSGAEPVSVLSPTTLAFADQNPNKGSQSLSTTVTNSGNVPLTISGTTLSNTTDYSVSGCDTPVGPGNSCDISVTFAPKSVGSKQATLTVTSDAPQSPQMATMTGSGVTSPVSNITPTTLTFTDQGIKSGTEAKIVKLTNTGSASLSISSLTLSNTADYSVSNGCGATVIPDRTCDITVTFAPQSVGAKAATLTLVTNAPQNPQTITLSSNAFEPVGYVSNMGSMGLCGYYIVGFNKATNVIHTGGGWFDRSCENYGLGASAVPVNVPLGSVCGSSQREASDGAVVHASGLVVTRGSCADNNTTAMDNAVFVANPANGTMKVIRIPGTPAFLPIAMSADSGTIYAITNSGVFAIDPVALTATLLVDSQSNVQPFTYGSAVVDANNPNVIWAAQGGILYRYDRTTNSFSQRTITGMGGGPAPVYVTTPDSWRRGVATSAGIIYQSIGTQIVAINTADASVRVFAGSAIAGNTDGVGTAATFKGAYGINISADESYIYVSDLISGYFYNRRIKLN